MELEEMQATWSKMSDRLDQQEKLTSTLIMKMTQKRYYDKIGILSKYEGLGAVVCFAAALVLTLQFHKLDTWYLLASGIFTVVYLIVLPAIVLRLIFAMERIELVHTTYTETLIAYTKKRTQFLLTQRIGIYTNFILLIASLPVLVKVFKDIDIFKVDTNIIFWYVPLMAIFLALFSRWGYGKYKKVTESASKVIQELEASKS